MKKRIIISASISIALCASIFSSCTKQEESLAPITKNSRNIDITFVEELSETKTEFYGKTTRWSKGDKITFGQYAFVEEVGTFKSSSVTLSAATETLTANITYFNDPDEGTNSCYFAVYPGSSLKSYDGTSLKNYLNSGGTNPAISATIPQTQTPVVTDGVPTGFDPNADLLISNLKDNLTRETEGAYEGKYVVKLTYDRKVAIGKMTIKNLQSDSPVTSIEISANKENGSAVTVAGEMWYNLLTGNIASTRTAYKSVILDYSSNPVTLSGENMTAYFCCRPFSLKENDVFCVVVKTEAGEVFTKFITVGTGRELVFEANKGTQFSVDMLSAVKSNDWVSVSEYNSGTSVKTATKIYFLAKETTDLTISSGKYAAIPESTFLDPSFDIATYFETNGSAMAASSINSFNSGKSLIFSYGSLEPDSWYIVAIKLVAVDTDSNEVVGYAFAKIKTDWFSLTASTRTAGGITFYFYGKGLVSSSRNYRFIATDALPEGQTFEQYYTNTLAPGGISSSTLSAINENGKSGKGYYTTTYYTGKSTTDTMTPGTNYTIMIKVNNERGETKFCYASANAGGTTE